MRYLVLLAVLVLLVACGADPATSTPAPTPTAPPTSTPAATPTLSAQQIATLSAQRDEATATAAQQKGAQDCPQIVGQLQALSASDWTAYRRSLIDTWVADWQGTVDKSDVSETLAGQVRLTIYVAPSCYVLAWVGVEQARFIKVGDAVTVRGVIDNADSTSDAVILALLPVWVR